MVESGRGGSAKAMSLLERLKTFRRARLSRAAVGRTALFDEAWYRARNPDAPEGRAGLIEHYLREGSWRGERPSPWFDPAWYLRRYPDLADSRIEPLAHYVLYGAREGRDPNPAFATRWYATSNPEASRFPTPLDHYVLKGAAAMLDPSPGFDVAWYLEQYPDAAEGYGPLADYLLQGREAGRLPAPPSEDLPGDPVSAARLEAFKPLEPVRDEAVALMMAFAPGGRLKPNVKPLVEGLAEAGVRVVLIVASDHAFAPDPALTPLLAGGYVRDNAGFDFAAWAHLMRAEPQLFAARTLILLNDSIIGPVGKGSLSAVLRRIEESPADVVGATQSWEYAWHLQSYFLAFKRKALSTVAFHAFFGAVRSLKDKDAVIRAYELTLAARMQAAGLECAALFESRDRENQTVFHWRALLDDGFPFVKTLVLAGAYPTVDIEGWRELLAARGFDPAVAEATVEARAPAGLSGDEGREKGAKTPRPPRTLLKPADLAPPAVPWKVAFVGPWNYASGLALASRGYLSALWRTGARLSLHPIEQPFHIHHRLVPTVAARDFEGPADAVVIHLNPDGWGMLSDEQKRIIDRARVRIGLWVWEMGHVPDFWFPNFEAVDAIWTPSRYCAEVFAGQTKVPVDVVPHVVPIPPQEAGAGLRRAALLAELGLEPGARIVLYAFDGSSYLVRKNPEALVRAFGASGLAAKGWRLVLKTKNLTDWPEQAAALSRLVSATLGAQLIDRQMSLESMSALFEAADIYASPHRSEGFGLTVAEAMAMAKPVVATDYGGTRDFLDPACGYPVRAETVRLKETYGAYTKGGQWGEVDEAAFAAALAEAAARIDAGDHAMGERARARIAERLSAEAVGAAMRAGFDRLLSSSAKADAA